MKIFRKDKDEREKNEIMRISSIAFLIAIWGLIISIALKIFIFDLDLVNVASEFIILIICTIFIVTASYIRGIWDTSTNPGMKTYIVTSLVMTLMVNIPISSVYYIRYGVIVSDGATITDALRFFAIGFATTFILMFLAIALFGTLIKRRQKKLANKYAIDDNPQEN